MWKRQFRERPIYVLLFQFHFWPFKKLNPAIKRFFEIFGNKSVYFLALTERRIAEFHPNIKKSSTNTSRCD